MSASDGGAPRKIQLTSPADLFHIQKNLLERADALLNSDPPPPPGTKERVHAFIESLLLNALPNIEVNGKDITSLPKEEDEEDEEEYDGALHEKVIQQQAEIEKVTVKVTGLRREAPKRIAEGVKKAIEEAVTGDLRAERDIERPTEEDIKKRAEKELDKLGIGKDDGARETWEKDVVDVVSELKNSLPATASRLKRAVDALDQ